MLDIYARLVLVSSIYHVFLITSPISTLFGCLYFIPSYPVSAHLLLHVLGRPTVDTGGTVWEEALYYQTVGLLISQALLFSVASLKYSPTTAVLALLAFLLTLTRTWQLRSANVETSRSMLLQRCAELDAISENERARSGPPFSLRQYEAAAASERATLAESVLDGSERALGCGLNLGLHATMRGAGSLQRGASAGMDLVARARALGALERRSTGEVGGV